MSRLRNVFIVLALFTTSIARGAEPSLEERVGRVLQSRCLSCHLSDTGQGKLSLTVPSRLQELGLVDSERPEESYLLELVTPQNGHAEMPKDADPLSTAEIALLRDWIAAGARWTAAPLELRTVDDFGWWSLQPLAQLEDPLPRDVQPIDHFIQLQLREQGLLPVPQADPTTLYRRLSYDLTGLPPSLADLDQFLTDWNQNSEQAWEQAVDQLLSSSAFGEKWGQHWLDLVRYAETHGYDKDKPRNNAWPYRDYVIRSWNSDKPFDRFVREQIAGDALYPDEPDGVLGLGFLAAGPWDFVGHWEVGERKLDGRIAKHQDRDEMVGAVFNVFMSTTIQCAQCHHHKFDPIRMEDYYRLHAVLAAVDRADRVYEGLTGEEQQRQELVQQQLAAARQRLDKSRKELAQRVAERTGGAATRIAELQRKFGQEPQPQYGYHSQISPEQGTVKWVQLDLGEVTAVRKIELIAAFDRYNNIGAGFGFPVRFRVEGALDADFSNVLLLRDATAVDFPNPLQVPVEIEVQGRELRYLRITATKLAERSRDYIFALGEVRVEDARGEHIGRRANVTALDSIEAAPRWGKSNLVDGIAYQELNDPAALAEYRQLVQKQQAAELQVRTPKAMQQIETLQNEVKQLEQQLAAFPEGRLVYAATTNFTGGGQFQPTRGTPRTIHFLHRGDLRSPGDVMSPGAPNLWEGANQFFQNLDSGDEQAARAALAKYLTAPDNPLLWRSIVNRLWLWTFGAGMVNSPNDFGRMGTLPSHPELLDFLATRLRDDPEHSLKSIIRLLVTSETYRRSSAHHAENAAIDQANRYLWRANRRRLTAEELRDSLLLIAGKLDRSMYGPSFQDFVIEKPQHSPHYEYHLHDPLDPAAHRRSIYRYVVRSQPQPFLTTLDCADPSLSVPQRDESTTALQALALWNNRLIAVMSEAFADRLTQDTSGLGANQNSNVPKALQQQIRRGWQQCTGREIEPQQLAVLEAYAAEHGLANMCRVLLNLNEFVYLD